MTREGFAPFAVDRHIPPGTNDPPITPRVVILHVDGGNAASLYEFFGARSGGIESHFHVKRNGLIEQYRSIYRQADANHRANGFAVSIETQGYADGEWTQEQIDGIYRLIVWLHDEAGIPLVKCSTWDGSGVGYHIQFGSPGKWTPKAKSCPGPDRIKQFDRIIVPGLAALRGAIEEELDDMTTEQFKRLIESLTRLEEMARVALGPEQEKTALARADKINQARKWS
jgi:hypothetical protein